jgi:hypothetical protein
VVFLCVSWEEEKSSGSLGRWVVRGRGKGARCVCVDVRVYVKEKQ